MSELNYVISSKTSSMSKSFIFPLLNVPIKPYNPSTYLFWPNGNKDIGNYELIVYYKGERDYKYLQWEKELVKHPYIQECYILEEGKGTVYVFDMSFDPDTVDSFIKGAYSEYLEDVKKQIKKYWGETGDPAKKTKQAAYLIAFHPEHYRELAAEELGMDIRELGKELAGIYNREVETFYGEPVGSCCESELLLSENTL